MLSRVGRIALSVAFGVLFGWLAYTQIAAQQPALQGADFTYAWLAGRAILQRTDAYDFARHAASPTYGVGLFYPLTAGVIALPLTVFSAPVAAGLFAGIGAGLLAFAISGGDPWRLLILVSAPMARATVAAQWSPLLTAASILTPILGLIAAKPTVALPLFAMQSRRSAFWSAILGGLGILLVSLLAQPDWPLRWLDELRSNPLTSTYNIPIRHPLGVIVGLAALRWRRPEARLLLGMACIPQTGFFYDQLPLMLIPRTRAEIAAAVGVSLAALALGTHVVAAGQSPPMQSAGYYPYMIAGVYLPALVMVLRRPHARAQSRSQSDA